MTRNVDFLIVGGGVAGTTAAGTIRSLKPDSSIVILSAENCELYSRILLTSYIRSEVMRDRVFLKAPAWYQENRIELIKGVSAQKLDTNAHTVECKNGDIYQYEPPRLNSRGILRRSSSASTYLNASSTDLRFKYKKLLLALGARPIKLNVPGSELASISYMWTIEDAEKIVTALKTAKRGVIIGGGFIGLEFAHAFKVKGIETTILDGSEYYWGNRLDKQSSQVIVNILEKNSIKVIAGEMAEKFAGSQNDPQRVGQVITKSGKEFECDLVGIGVGIKSDLAWLEGSGVKIDQGIITNEYLETNFADVYAAGDCANFYDVILEGQHLVGTWANATIQGTIVGKTMTGIRTNFEAVSAYTARFFDSTCSFVGMTEADFADEVVTRGTVAEGKIARIFVKHIRGTTRIIGAIIVNDFNEVALITTAIKNRVNIAHNLQKLTDLSFDLHSILMS